MLFRGREIAHQDIGRELLVKLSQQLAQVAIIDQPPHMEGRTMVMFLSPNRAVTTESENQAEQVEP